MTQAQIVRSFAADPAGVALLLAGPVADSLWSAPAPAEADAPAVVHHGPPLRAGVGFVVELSVRDPVVGSVRGRLSLEPETGELPVVGTTARLVLTSPSAADHELSARGEQFLDALGSLAVARSTAA